MPLLGVSCPQPPPLAFPQHFAWRHPFHPGPPWFIGWLLILNVVYTTFSGEAKAMEFPSIRMMALYGLGLSAVQPVVIAVCSQVTRQKP